MSLDCLSPHTMFSEPTRNSFDFSLMENVYPFFETLHRDQSNQFKQFEGDFGSLPYPCCVLVFVYDRNQMNVLEVNKTDYENCISDHPLHNFTTGAGRDVVHLNVTRPYYFISGKGFCYGGMKLAIHVEHLPPPPSALPMNEKSSALRSTYTGHTPFVLTAVFAIAAVFEAFSRVWQRSVLI